ncbi:MAG: DUF2156 domain-containing protein [Ruminococcus sp.]|nr:DUF2156 domain-containing protein [Ruminococcus sp.]
MLDFKTPKKDDVPYIRKICQNYGTMGCDFNAANIFLWRNKYNAKICIYCGFLVLAYFRDNAPWGYCFPVGEGDPTAVIAEIFKDAKQRGIEARFVMLTDAQKEKLVEITGYEYSFEELLSDEDYIYCNYDLTILPGQKYHAKRNHISKFNRKYPNWRFSMITKDNKSDALKVAEKWCKNKEINPYINEEFSVISEALDNYEFLQMHGGILYVEDEPVAMTMGCSINQKTFDVIFEKALVEYDGAFSKVNNEFAKTLVGFEFINREEDMGLESLRKAKLSYHPAVILKRYIGVRNDKA